MYAYWYDSFSKITFLTHQHVSVNVAFLRYEVSIGGLPIASTVQVTLFVFAVARTAVVRETVWFFITVNFANIVALDRQSSDIVVF